MSQTINRLTVLYNKYFLEQNISINKKRFANPLDN